MIDLSGVDYSSFDHPGVTAFLFYPRPAYPVSLSGAKAESVMIPVEEGVEVEARFHLAEGKAPDILFFHGNGEIVADYDEIAMLYNRMGITFIPVDYRGYGRSSGRPTMTAMMRDAHVVFDYVKNRREHRPGKTPLVVMGRSLGSAPALELAAHYRREIDGLVIESGFAYIGPLLRLMGIRMESHGLMEEKGPRNLDKIRRYDGPTLVIHAQHDQIISLEEGQALYAACPSPRKKLLVVPGANHNDIFLTGFRSYMEAIRDLLETIGRTGSAGPAPGER